jgi:hypothetical protein
MTEILLGKGDKCNEQTKTKFYRNCSNAFNLLAPDLKIENFKNSSQHLKVLSSENLLCAGSIMQ